MKSVPASVLAVLLATSPAPAEAQTDSSAEISEVYREVSLLRPQASAAPAKLGDIISGSTALRTGVQSRSELTFPDETLLRLGANTQFSFLPGKHEFNLSRGTALLKTSRKTGGARIQAGGITAAISGSLAIFNTPPVGEAGIAKLLLFYGKSSLTVCGVEHKLKPWQMAIVVIKEGGQPDCDSVQVIYFDADTTARTSKLINLKDEAVSRGLAEGKAAFLAGTSFTPVDQEPSGGFPDNEEINILSRIMPMPEPPPPPPPIIPESPEEPVFMPPPPRPLCPPGEAFDEDFMKCFPIRDTVDPG